MARVFPIVLDEAPGAQVYFWTLDAKPGPKTVYRDPSCLVPAARPLLLDAMGEAEVWLEDDSGFTISIVPPSRS